MKTTHEASKEEQTVMRSVAESTQHRPATREELACACRTLRTQFSIKEIAFATNHSESTIRRYLKG